jgi:hypothetical protein
MRDTIDMAREAGIKHDIDGVWCDVCELKAFEALVRADERSVEREACAKVCEGATELGCEYWSDVAEAIRARGNT